MASQSTQPQSGEPRPRPPEPLLSLRATVVMLLALLTGVASGVLAHLAGQPMPAAVLVGGSAAGGALSLFHRIVGRQVGGRSAGGLSACAVRLGVWCTARRVKLCGRADPASFIAFDVHALDNADITGRPG